MWQELREIELRPAGIEVVTVALDTGGPEHALKHVERAGATHPSLLDASHLLDERLGIVNVPSGVWVDEDGVIVRPPEPAHAVKDGPSFVERLQEQRDELPEEVRETLDLAAGIRHEAEPYLDALRDWAANGADSRYALSEDEVVERSRPVDADVARAAACFELGQHLHRAGHEADARRWFGEAHRLDPRNWTYKRQAWQFVSPVLQGPTDSYDGDWAGDVAAIGPENYYPPLELEPRR